MISWKFYRFVPRLIPTAIFLVFFSCLLALGFWQLDRAAQKKMILSHYQTRSPVTIKGHFDNAHTLLLDNKIYQQRVGYHVFSPLIMDGGKAILINRGWVPADLNRDILPKIKPIHHSVELTGFLTVPSKTFMLKQIDEVSAQWPLRVQTIDLVVITKKLGYQVLPNIMQLRSDQPYGFVRDWQPVLPMGVEKHYGYAFQWFALAATLLIIFIVVNTKKSTSIF